MNNLIRELRQRGVLRVAGLYIALTWLVLQVADVVLAALGLPDSVVRYILFVAVGGFPIAVLLTWFFEFTSEGIRTEEEVREEGAERAGNSALTVATILALVLALGISLFVNFEQATEEPVVEHSLVSILVADFENLTGDPLFDGSLEAALTIGMEGASFITSYARHNALKVAERITAGSSLNEESARLVSVREGIDLVLMGSISKTGDVYELSQRVLDPVEGNLVAEVQASADGKAEVLPAVGALAAQIREALGDVSLEGGSLAASETFTAASLAAVQYYTQAQTHAFQEENVEAIRFFEKAVAEDPEFGRAYSGWATSEIKLGHREKAEELWAKTLSLIDGMTERERYRTLGAYYLQVTSDYSRAIENYQLLVEKYPADGIGWSNLGVAYFYTLQFAQALEVGAQLVELFPGNPAFRANYALFAMYAGDFAVARTEAGQLNAEYPSYFLAYLPLAMAEIVDGKLVAAEAVYQTMGQFGERAQSLSVTGLADIALLTGDYPQVAQLLQQGRETDRASGNSRGAAYKGIYLAKAQAAMGDPSAALDNLAGSLEGNNALSHLIPAALLYIELGELERAAAIQQQLGAKLQQGHRAAAELINAEIALANNDAQAAIIALNASLTRNDAWLSHYALGRALAAAGDHALALAEFELCLQRIGEATALYLDDIPTFHYHAPLYYWLGRTQQELGMVGEARQNLDHYLSLRVAADSSPWTEDARSR